MKKRAYPIALLGIAAATYVFTSELFIISGNFVDRLPSN